MTARLWPTLGLLYGAAFWGAVWYPSRALEAAGISGAWLTLIGYSAAFVVLAPFVRHCMRALRRDRIAIAAMIIAAGWTNVAFVLAVLDGAVVRVLLLFYLSPIWATVLGRYLLGETWTRQTVLMLGLGLSGAVIMLWDPRIGEVPLNHADWLAISAGFTFALNNVLIRRIDHVAIASKTHLSWSGVIVVSLCFVVLQSPSVPQAGVGAWWGAVALGIGGFMLSTLAVVYGVSHMPVQRSAVIMLFELLVGAATAWWLAGEVVTVTEWVGGLAILAAALIAILHPERHQR